GRIDVRVTFGPPITVRPGDDRFEIREEVRRFMEGCGASTTPDPKRLRRVAARERLREEKGEGPGQAGAGEPSGRDPRGNGAEEVERVEGLSEEPGRVG